MRKFDERPLKQRLVAIMLVTTTVVIVLAGLPFVVYETVTFRRTSLESLAGLGDIVASNSTAALAFANAEDAQDVLATLRARPHIVAAALYNDRGELFAHYPASLPADAFPPAPAADGVVTDGAFLTAYRPVLESGNHRLGTLFIREDTAEIAARMKLYAYMAAGMLALSLIAGYIVAGRLQGRISGPILALANTARAIAERNDYSVRAQKLAHAEIGLLTDAFNQMLDQIERQARQVRETNERLDIVLRADNARLEQRVHERTLALEAANEELRAFSYSVAHDLRAPLRAMHGFSEALLEDCKDSTDEMAQEYARRIAAAARRMDDLTRDLLAYSQVSRSELALTPVDLGSVVSEATRQLEADIASRKARVTVHEPLPRAIAHTPALVQSVANLLANALKFTADGRTPVIDIRAEEVNGMARLWVEDNGIGIAPAHHQRVFTVFERLHSGPEYAGTGIGLAIVRKAIERMGGRVGVESEVGQGSRFWIDLKRAEA